MWAGRGAGLRQIRLAGKWSLGPVRGVLFAFQVRLERPLEVLFIRPAKVKLTVVVMVALCQQEI